MSANIIVSGLPNDVLFPKLIYAFKGILRKIFIKKFWIRDLSDSYGKEGKQMTVEFTNNAEARKARTFLNNRPFINGKMEYQLRAQMAEGGMQMHNEMEEDWGRERKPMKRERPRSRSPSYNARQEASKLDLEIELLRKQRQVIEEERRLLLEQKKLDMIKEYGPSATGEFDDFDVYEPPRKRRHPEPVQAMRPRHKTPPLTQNPPKNRPKGLPVFFQPCKKLIADMKPFIEKDTTSEEAEILVKLIRTAIRKDLAIALDGKDYMPTGEILKLYREKRPKENDESFVAKILANIRASYLTSDIKVEKKDTNVVKEENVTENQKDDNKEKENATDKQTDKENEGQGNQVANDKIAPQDTPANEENGTDAVAPDLGIQVKSEPDTSQELQNVPEEVSQPAENASKEMSQPAESASKEMSQPAENASKEMSQEQENISKENGSAEVVIKATDSEEFDKMFKLEDTETATDLLTEGDLQDADDWVEEQ